MREVLLANERKSKEKSKNLARRRYWWLVSRFKQNLISSLWFYLQ